jgi:uncharacterized caspase-like protein
MVVTAFPALAEQRLALVIGNDAYPALSAGEQLHKAVNDANAVGDALEELGFAVTRGENLSRAAMLAKLVTTTSQLQPGDFAFFFFAGHGVSIDGANYLLPADIPAAEEGGEQLIKFSAVSEAMIVQELRSRGVRVAVVVLDACRNNPFSRGGTRAFGDGARGLARPPTVETQGVFGLYSAGFGEQALDRLGDTDDDPNSVFTRVLVPELRKPGQSLIDIAYSVNDKVAELAKSVGHEQNPAYYDQSRARDIFLAALQDVQQPTAGGGDQGSVGGTDSGSCASARPHFEASRASNRVEALEDHVARFGHCEFAVLARILIDQINGDEQVAVLTPGQLQPTRTTTDESAIPATTLDPDATARALVRAMTGGTPILDGGMTGGVPFVVTFDIARREGADIVVEGLRIQDSETAYESLVFGRTVLSGAATTPEGNLKIARIEFRDGVLQTNATPPRVYATLESFTVTDFATVTRLMAGPGASAFSYAFASMEMANLKLIESDAPIVVVGRTFLEASDFAGDQPRSTKGGVEGLTIMQAAFHGDQFMASLGYDPFMLQVSWEGLREGADIYTIRDLSVTLEDGGVLSASGVAGGVTPLDFLLGLSGPQNQEVLRKARLQSLSIHYRDASLGGRAMDAFVAANLKSSRAEFVQQAVLEVQQNLALDPGFELKLTQLLIDFMLEPSAFDIELAPATPVSGEEIVEIMTSAPQTLHERLGVSIKVNQPE